MKPLHLPWRFTLGEGWRRVAGINTIAVTTFTISTIILLALSVSQSDHGLHGNLVFFNGDCAKSRAINLWLHLLLNVFSTGVIASSNFFMQVLSSPTRREVDEAHRKGFAMEIGVSSLRNIFHVAWFKGVWLFLFFASSFPIHLFFNSAIFSTEYQGAGFHLTIASEKFVEGAQYFGPGALLWPAGVFGLYTEAPDYEKGSGYKDAGYGLVLDNVTDYWDPTSVTAKSIKFASQYARGWKRLEVAECLSQYVYCNPHNDFRDVVWVVKSHNTSGDFMVSGNNNTLGWQPNQLLAQMDSTDSAFWEPHYPVGAANSLWFAANCSTIINFNIVKHQTDGCLQSCSGATGYNVDKFYPLATGSIPGNYTYDFLPDLGLYGPEARGSLNWPGLSDPSAATLDLEYCLAEPISTTCKVALSNRLLLVVVICLVVKSCLCFLVVFTMRRQLPLVTPGDAIASFISSPDEFTAGRCTLDSKLDRVGMMGRVGRYAAVMGTPRQWFLRRRRRRWTSAIGRFIWFGSYSLFAFDIIFVGVMFGMAQRTTPLGSGNQSLSESPSNGILTTDGETPSQLFSSVITVNLPQLLLSVSYFVYSSLYSRLCAEKEWSSYGTDYHPLRVTHPAGQQRSSYRLQLPYRYSVPLIVISILLHWLVSNALYVFVLEGGYYWIHTNILDFLNIFVTPATTDTGLSNDAYVGVGYSTIALLVILIAAIILPAIPIILGKRTIKSPMPYGGTNSRVISAACHVPVPEDVLAIRRGHGSDTTPAATEKRLLAVRESEQATNDLADTQEEYGVGIFRLQRLRPSYAPLSGEDWANDGDKSSTVRALDAESFLLNVSQRPVRWGAVDTPRSWDQQHAADATGAVGHLSFGTREHHHVQEPVEGKLYA